MRDLSVETYVGGVAVFFTALGIWAGQQLTISKTAQPTSPPAPKDLEAVLKKINLSKREMEVLTLIAQGLSNKEIAQTLFLSPHTVKTHSSNIFLKLGVSRRTQAVQKALETGLLDQTCFSG